MRLDQDDLPSLEDTEGINLLGRLLSEASYTDDAVADVLNVRRHRNLWGAKPPLFLRRTQEPTPLNTFIRLFFIGAGADEAAAEGAFGPLTLERVAAMGLIRPVGDEVQARIALTPYEGLVVGHDPWGPRSEQHELSVPGIAPSPRWLDRFTIRRQVDAALDIGTGSGVQALLASRHARSVTATDLNPRAVRFCRFNALLNGVDSLRVLQGDLFEPVSGERFDLIVCNPPYIVSPDAALLYSDGGIGAGGIVERVVRGHPDHLTEGGFACTVAEWGVGDGGDWSDEPRRWLRDAGCDALILGDGEQDTLAYVDGESSSLAPDPDAYAARLDGWLGAYEEAGISRIASAAIIQRRRRGRNWVHAEGSVPRRGDLTRHLLRIVDGRTLLEERSPNQLLQLRPRMADAFELEEHYETTQEGVGLKSRSVLLSEGLRYALAISEPEWAVISALDGRRSLGETVRDPGFGPDGVSVGLEVIRALLAHGFVEAEEPGEDG